MLSLQVTGGSPDKYNGNGAVSQGTEQSLRVGACEEVFLSSRVSVCTNTASLAPQF